MRQLAIELADKFDTLYGHPDYPKEDWRYDVRNGDTLLGYWDWVAHNVEADGGELCG